jgi:hypothetical protein
MVEWYRKGSQSKREGSQGRTQLRPLRGLGALYDTTAADCVRLTNKTTTVYV